MAWQWTMFQSGSKLEVAFFLRDYKRACTASAFHVLQILTKWLAFKSVKTFTNDMTPVYNTSYFQDVWYLYTLCVQWSVPRLYSYNVIKCASNSQTFMNITRKQLWCFINDFLVFRSVNALLLPRQLNWRLIIGIALKSLLYKTGHTLLGGPSLGWRKVILKPGKGWNTQWT